MDGPTPYTDATYISFGEAQGQMSLPPNNVSALYDTHGAGAQRNDPKEMGTSSYPSYFGPQGDILYVNNYVRAVRNVDSSLSIEEGVKMNYKAYPNPTESKLTIQLSKSYDLLNVKVSNVLGKTIDTFSFENKQLLDIELKGTPGIYFVQIQSSNGTSTTLKAVKE
jgi:hypothetical protein